MALAIAGSIIGCAPAYSTAKSPGKRAEPPIKELFSLIDSRQAEANTIAAEIQSSLLKLHNEANGVTEIVFAVGPLIAKFPGSKLEGGVLDLHHNDHDYRIYFNSLSPKPICWSFSRENGELLIRVKTPRLCDASLMVDAGLYEIYMVEDKDLCWQWFLDWSYTNNGQFAGVGGHQYGHWVEKKLKEQRSKCRCQ